MDAKQTYPEGWMPEDGRIADISYWGRSQEAEAATDPKDIELIRARREAFMRGENPDASGKK